METNFILISDNTHGEIYQISLSSGQIGALNIDNIRNPHGLTYSKKKRTIYWSDGIIYSATLDSRLGVPLLGFCEWFCIIVILSNWIRSSTNCGKSTDSTKKIKFSNT